ncbi:HlyC/CorC family transporter [Candidatus Woesearchaeota archaeon]|nr:HlyC/CorC family transporter [Candidatus Woesearchaeota archaeon]
MTLHAKIITLLVLIVFSSFFSGAEIALFSLSMLKAKYLVKKNAPGAKTVEKLKEKPHRLLTTILIGNNLVNVGASAIATSIAYDMSLDYAVSIATGIMTLFILVFGEITPKSFAMRNNEKVSLLVAKPLLAMQIVFFPVVILFESMFNLMTGKGKAKPIVTEEEIKTFISIGEEAGQIKESEKEMINRIFVFNDIEIKKIMTPRNNMVCISSESRIADIAKTFYIRGHSRIPVYKENLDNIEGFVHVLDVQKEMAKNKNSKVSEVMRPILFVPESTKLDVLLKFFQRKKQGIAVVVNDFGTNVGLVTIEDIVEEIVGEIIDEKEKVEKIISKISRNTYIIKGRATIGEVNEKCGIEIPEEEPYTVSSYILRHTGRIPQEGEVIEFPCCTVKIKSIEKNTIDEIIVKKRKIRKKFKK